MKRYTDEELENFLNDLESDLVERKESFRVMFLKRPAKRYVPLPTTFLIETKLVLYLSVLKMMEHPPDFQLLTNFFSLSRI